MIRFFDVLISILILTLLSPLIFIISILILITDGMPIIYKQIRIGVNGQKFFILKFRTMSNIKMKNEQLRLSVLGRFLRDQV